MHNAQSTMHNAQCTMHNAQCTMHNAPCNAQRTMQVPLLTAQCTLHTLLCLMPNAGAARLLNFSRWLQQNVVAEDFVVVKMDIEGSEYEVLPSLLRSRAVTLVDELLLEVQYSRMEGHLTLTLTLTLPLTLPLPLTLTRCTTAATRGRTRTAAPTARRSAPRRRNRAPRASIGLRRCGAASHLPAH